MEGFKNLCSLTSVLDGIGCTVMAHLDSLLLQAWAQRVECHYDYAQVKNANLSYLLLPIFCLKKIKKKKPLHPMGWLLIH